MIYRTIIYVNIYGSYKLLKTVRFFWPTLYIYTFRIGGSLYKLCRRSAL